MLRIHKDKNISESGAFHNCFSIQRIFDCLRMIKIEPEICLCK